MSGEHLMYSVLSGLLTIICHSPLNVLSNMVITTQCTLVMTFTVMSQTTLCTPTKCVLEQSLTFPVGVDWCDTWYSTVHYCTV